MTRAYMYHPTTTAYLHIYYILHILWLLRAKTYNLYCEKNTPWANIPTRNTGPTVGIMCHGGDGRLGTRSARTPPRARVCFENPRRKNKILNKQRKKRDAETFKKRTPADGRGTVAIFYTMAYRAIVVCLAVQVRTLMSTCYARLLTPMSITVNRGVQHHSIARHPVRSKIASSRQKASARPCRFHGPVMDFQKKIDRFER